MSLEIGINYFELLLAAFRAGSAVNAIDTDLDEWVSQGERSVSLDAFAEQFLELEKVMALFGEMLQKDVGSIKDIGEELFRADMDLSRLWGK